ncbi:MAG TPA: NAD(P)-dependent oxidoreductase [Solirubrobacteraceae bacterium]|nr:NAD(P)-dependent oxidoreductase [Solirubrobacteraceae bacterium]
MRIFVAGASGVIGRALVPLLCRAGHEVAGMTRSPERTAAIAQLGAQPVLCDVYDAGGLSRAVQDFAPEMVMHQLTDLPDDIKRLPLYIGRNNRIRTEGTRNLVAAAREAGALRFLAQSIEFSAPGVGKAVAEHERLVLEFGGVVLRYGLFYGAGTFGGTRKPPIGPRIHVEAAARRTVEFLEAASGVYRVVEE